MSFTVFLGNLPSWVTADDIMSWLTAEDLIADSIKVIRNPETQESKGFAFIEAPNSEEMQSIIRRFNRAPLEDRLLRANPAQPPRSRTANGVSGVSASPEEPRQAVVRNRRPAGTTPANGRVAATTTVSANPVADSTTFKKKRERSHAPKSAFAEELAKAL
jgi:RNA recognition motif-containing protein